MSDLIAAHRYTRALFELSDKEQSLFEVDRVLHGIGSLLETHPQVLRLAANPTLSDEEKYRFVQNLLGDNAPELLRRFFKMLIEKKRFALLPQIQAIFHKSYEKKKGVQEVEIASATPFSKGFLEKLTAFLKKKLRSAPGSIEPEARREIRLIPKTEQDLLGGFILRFDGKEIDCSFKNRIYEIQQKLFSPLEEGNI